MNDRTEIDIILPCYNPPPGWEQKVIGKFKEIQSLFSPIDFHLLIVSDGSRRGYEPETVAALEQGIPGIQIIDYRPNRGKGYALRKAVQCYFSPLKNTRYAGRIERIQPDWKNGFFINKS